jgi:hypothetical protein
MDDELRGLLEELHGGPLTELEEEARQEARAEIETMFADVYRRYRLQAVDSLHCVVHAIVANLGPAVGLSAAKARLTRRIGIPPTRSGRRRKIGRGSSGCCDGSSGREGRVRFPPNRRSASMDVSLAPAFPFAFQLQYKGIWP